MVNLFSSFAYFDDEADDRRVVAGVARALRPGGAFVLETINPPGLLSRFRPQNWQTLDDGTLLAEERGYDVRRGRNRARWVFVRPDGERSELRHSIRLYTYPELAALLLSEGLELEADWGGYDGSELTRESFRLVVLGRKRRRLRPRAHAPTGPSGPTARPRRRAAQFGAGVLYGGPKWPIRWPSRAGSRALISVSCRATSARRA